MNWLSRLFGRASTMETGTQGDTTSTNANTTVCFEQLRPEGGGACSWDLCPCGPFGAPIPRGSGYLWIPQAVVDARRDCLKWDDYMRKLDGRLDRLPAGSAILTRQVAVLVCEQGVRRLGIDPTIAAADAKHWWATGLVPLRATPPQHNTEKDKITSNKSKEMREMIWNQVSPIRTSPPDLAVLNGLADDAVPALIDIVSNPKDPTTAIACNQGILTFILANLAKKGNEQAAAFLRRIANDEIPLFDAYGQMAYEAAKEYVAATEMNSVRSSEHRNDSVAANEACADCGRSNAKLTSCMHCNHLYCDEHGEHIGSRFVCFTCMGHVAFFGELPVQ